MPWTYRIDRRAGVLFIASEGDVSQAERLQAIRAWQSDSDYRPGLRTLCDFTDGGPPPSFQDLRQLAALIVDQLDVIGRTKLAVIAERPVIYGAARQFQALLDATPVEMQVFWDRDAAWAWLAGRDR